jgi:hypothetical protein
MVEFRPTSNWDSQRTAILGRPAPFALRREDPGFGAGSAKVARGAFRSVLSLLQIVRSISIVALTSLKFGSREVIHELKRSAL